MSLSTTAKASIGGLGAIAAGSPVAVYLGKDHIDYYEVERKVINGESSAFAFEEDKKDSNLVGWKIKTSKEDPDWDSEDTKKYYWECKIEKPSSFTLDIADLEIRLKSLLGGNTESIRRHLIKVCSKNRSEPKSKRVESTFTFPSNATKENWSEHLFGEKDLLNETEKEVLKDNVYFNIPNPTTSPLSITATAQVDGGGTWGYQWQCTINSDGGIITNFDTRFPKSASETTTPEYKKANKKKLVYACSKSRTTNEDKRIVATISTTKGALEHLFKNS